MSCIRRCSALRLVLLLCTLAYGERLDRKDPLLEAHPIEGLPNGSGSVPLDCGGVMYAGPINYLHQGGYGLAATMRNNATHNKVVLKMLKNPSVPASDLHYECGVLQQLVRAGVPNLLSCEAECTGMFVGRMVPVIVTSPFFATGENIPGPLNNDKFKDKSASKTAREETLRTGFHMLAQGVCNADQDQNILYDKNSGRTLFIDVGMAVTISRDLKHMSHSQAWAAWAPMAADMDTKHWQDPKASVAVFLRILLEKSSSLSLHEVRSIWDEAWPHDLRRSHLYWFASELFEQYQMAFASREGNVTLVQELLGRMQQRQRLQEELGSKSEEVLGEWDTEVLAVSINVARSQGNTKLLKILLSSPDGESFDLSLDDAVTALDATAVHKAIVGSPCSDLNDAVTTLEEVFQSHRNHPESLKKIEKILNLLLTAGKETHCLEEEFGALEMFAFPVLNQFKRFIGDEHLKDIFYTLLPYTNCSKDNDLQRLQKMIESALLSREGS